MNYSRLITETEEYLRKGQVAEATGKFKTIPLSKVPTLEILPVARLGRRTGQISAALKLLQRQITQKQPIETRSIEFKAEYAVLLTLHGCVNEALSVLKDVNTQAPPEALIAKAWCYFEVWEHSNAVPLLKKYIRVQKDPYFKLAGRVNLAEAYLGAGDPLTSIDIATTAINEASKQKYKRLEANSLHIRAQAYEQTRNLSNSNEDLKRAMTLFGQASTPDAFLIRRQIAFNQATHSKGTHSVVQIKKEALDLGEYESVRLCDLRLLDHKFSNELFNKLYFGSPYESFRSLLRKTFPTARTGKHILWGNKSDRLLDLTSKQILYNGTQLEATPQIERLLLSLLLDWYNPPRIGTLFALAFPGSHFLANHSPTVAHQGLKRLRHWFLENGIPLSIYCQGRRYSLKQEQPLAIRLNVDCFKKLTHSTAIEKLLKAFGEKGEFTLQQAKTILELSKATTHRVLVTEIFSGHIEKKNMGKNTIYTFKKP